jgi:flavodoxin
MQSGKENSQFSILNSQLIRVELATPEDLLNCDLLILASSTWNTGGPEGQLNPHMHAFVFGRGKDIALNGKNVAIVGLGDTRYHYTCRAADYLEQYVRDHGGKVISTLKILNEPYGQEATITQWAKSIIDNEQWKT